MVDVGYLYLLILSLQVNCTLAFHDNLRPQVWILVLTFGIDLNSFLVAGCVESLLWCCEVHNISVLQLCSCKGQFTFWTGPHNLILMPPRKATEKGFLKTCGFIELLFTYCYELNGRQFCGKLCKCPIQTTASPSRFHSAAGSQHSATRTARSMRRRIVQQLNFHQAQALVLFKSTELQEIL